jgi:spore germination protein GerM
MSRRRAGVAAVTVTVALVCACGLPTEKRARRIPDEAVPFGLLSSAPVAAATPEPGQRLMSIFFVREDRLVRVERRVAAEPDAALALEHLARGPSPTETQAGIGTAALDVPLLARGGPDAATVSVDLGQQIGEFPSQIQVLAFAQIVYTLADLPAVEAVAFTLDGEPVDVLRGDGSLADAPVTPADYAGLAPE